MSDKLKEAREELSEPINKLIEPIRESGTKISFCRMRTGVVYTEWCAKRKSCYKCPYGELLNHWNNAMVRITELQAKHEAEKKEIFELFENRHKRLTEMRMKHIDYRGYDNYSSGLDRGIEVLSELITKIKSKMEVKGNTKIKSKMEVKGNG
jgi:hypothetical protein